MRKTILLATVFCAFASFAHAQYAEPVYSPRPMYAQPVYRQPVRMSSSCFNEQREKRVGSKRPALLFLKKEFAFRADFEYKRIRVVGA